MGAACNLGSFYLIANCTRLKIFVFAKKISVTSAKLHIHNCRNADDVRLTAYLKELFKIFNASPVENIFSATTTNIWLSCNSRTAVLQIMDF